jgi:DNA-binding FrmR family transcriptional regulator
MEQKELVFLTCYLQVILADLKTVTRMIEDQRPYNQIIFQIGAIRRALRVLGYSLIACQVRESVAFLQGNPDLAAQTIELSQLQDLYEEIIKTPFLKMR